MKSTDVIKLIMKDQGLTQMVYSKRLGIGDSTLRMRLSQKNLSVNLLKDMLSVVGYKLVIMPDILPTPKGGYEIDE